MLAPAYDLHARSQRFDTEPKDGIMIFAEFKKAWMEIKDHMDT